MKKRKLWLLSLLTAALCLGSFSGNPTVYATENEAEEESENPYPDSYYLPVESNATKGWPTGPTIEAEAAVVMDAETGAFLYSKNMDGRCRHIRQTWNLRCG